jgi:hypothetical protein
VRVATKVKALTFWIAAWAAVAPAVWGLERGLVAGRGDLRFSISVSVRMWWWGQPWDGLGRVMECWPHRGPEDDCKGSNMTVDVVVKTRINGDPMVE